MRDDKTDLPRFAASDVPAAIGLLTRLPVPVDHAKATARGGRAAWAYPLAGLVVAVLAGAVGWTALFAGLPYSVAAGLSLLVLIVVTGAMHEDGIADCADGFWGGYDRDRRLEIMKDSRIGAYGVIALVMSLLLRLAAYVALFHAGYQVDGSLIWVGFILAAMGSRTVMVAVMALLPHARAGGLSAQVGRPDRAALFVATGITLVATFLLWPAAIGMVVLVGGLAGTACAAIATRKIGGQTGDVLGATQQVSEIAILLGLTALI